MCRLQRLAREESQRESFWKNEAARQKKAAARANDDASSIVSSYASGNSNTTINTLVSMQASHLRYTRSLCLFVSFFLHSQPARNMMGIMMGYGKQADRKGRGRDELMHSLGGRDADGNQAMKCLLQHLETLLLSGSQCANNHHDVPTLARLTLFLRHPAGAQGQDKESSVEAGGGAHEEREARAAARWDHARPPVNVRRAAVIMSFNSQT